MINTYNLFELKQTQKFKLLKIFLAYNIETDPNLIKDFFYHGGTSPTKFLGRYVSIPNFNL